METRSFPLNKFYHHFGDLIEPMNQTLFSIFHFREDYLPHYIEELKNGGYEFIVGYPSAITVISNYILSVGEEIRLKAVFPLRKAFMSGNVNLLKKPSAAKCMILTQMASSQR